MKPEDIHHWHYNVSKNHISKTVNEAKSIIESHLINDINIVDVGSNTGMFTKLLSDKFHINNAVLIEPIPELLEFSKNILPNNYKHINKAIVGDPNIKETTMTFPHDPDDLNLGIGRIDVHGNMKVSCQTLSSILQEIDFVPNYIKIDAEGYDTKILLSIADDIRDIDTKPIITFEIDKTQQQDDLKRIELIFVNELNYKMVDYRKQSWTTDIHLIPN